MNYNMTGKTGVVGGYSEAINIPGTIVGTLKDVSATNQYLRNAQRYNNYLTSNYGAAQEASDRYMTLKERIPMSIEYYLTPSQKKEVVMYINPNKIQVNTQKLKAKVITRGGIYFHHYGDDIWTMTITGETGLSNMKGIEALEEVYHYSGSLLKYQGITQQTVHTNNIGSATGGSGNSNSGLFGGILGASGFGGLGDSVSKYLNDKIGGTLQSALGLNNKELQQAMTTNPNVGVISGCFPGITNNTANCNMTQNLAGGIGGTFVTGLMSNAMGSNNLVSIDSGKSFSANMDNVKNSFNTLMQGFNKDVIGTLASEMVLSSMGMGGQNLNYKAYAGQTGLNISNFIGSISNLLSGIDPNAKPENVNNYIGKSTQGNFYVLGQLTAYNMNLIVNSVQETNRRNLIDHEKVAKNWSDMEDQYTDLYRPRQIFIYFDDRIFIGHFDSLNWTRVATTKSISYDMKFTICRQIIVQRSVQGFLYGSGSGNLFSGGLSGVLTGLGVGLLGGAVGSLLSKSGNNQQGTTNNSNSSSEQEIFSFGANSKEILTIGGNDLNNYTSEDIFNSNNFM